MLLKRLLAFFSLLAPLVFGVHDALGQAPLISYATPQTYTVNNTIPALSPVNKGGAVPPGLYGEVSKFAGTGLAGTMNGTGTAASFSAPLGLTVDARGNIYVGDYNNNIIRKITPAGVVTTYAGIASTHGAADGPASTATFTLPEGVAIDKNGNIYVADSFNNLIRKISPQGAVSTIAGVYGMRGSADGTVLTATFNSPTDVAVDDAGNVYVADNLNNVIRKISSGGIVSTLAGIAGVSGSKDGPGASATFNSPLGIAIDNTGNFYVADALNNKIRKITPAGVVSTFAGDGTAGDNDAYGPSASFNDPNYIAVDGYGNLYVTDQKNNKVRKITSAGYVSTLAGTGAGGSVNGPAATATFSYPGSIAFDGTGGLYVGDISTFVIRKINLSGYTIDKPLPAGLLFDQTNGTISGKPTIPSPTIVYTVTAYNASGSSSTPVTITVTDPQAVTFNPIPTKTVCDADFDPGATSTGAITYTSSNPAVAVIVSGKIHITGPGTSLITATSGASSVNTTLTVVAAVTPSVTISPVTAEDCGGVAVEFTAIPINGGDNPQYQWQVNGVDAGVNSATFSSSTLANGDKITCMLTSDAVCTISATVISNIAVFTLDPASTASINISTSETGAVCPGTTITFTATATTTDNNPGYQWQVNGINKGTNSDVFSAGDFANGDVVTCILTSSAKCLVNPESTSNAITVNVSPPGGCPVVIPNVITPNGDGINDFWDINILQGYPECSVLVYNRAGTIIFNSKGYPKPWDGTYKGNALPAGTYYYIVDLKNGKKPFAGFITILK